MAQGEGRMTDPRTALAALLNGDGLTRVSPAMLQPANPFFDLAGEEFGRRLMLTAATDGTEYCLRPDFTLPIAKTYLESAGAGQPAGYGYLGTIFRQRAEGPAEFEQAGIELIGQPDADLALRRVFAFAREALAIYGVGVPSVRLGSVALFEALLAGADIPDVWRPRLRQRFGHPESMAQMLDRLSDPHGASGYVRLERRDELIDTITDEMLSAGLSITDGRRPEEIADRYIEKQALGAAYVPGETIQLLRDYLSIEGPVDDALNHARSLVAQAEIADAALAAFGAAESALRNHDTALASVPNAGIVFEAGFSPRLDYYTGLVFEMHGRDESPLASGGQYDRLMERLGAKTRIAASGCAVWVDRLQKEAGA
jgi:ATP phosphoribosyltransferase regulatory subunit